MNSTLVRVCVCALLGLGSWNASREAAAGERLHLDGTWSFATDPDNRGEAEQWFRPEAVLPKMPRPGYAPTADGTIQVPGVWDNQGYGVATDKVRHNFVGKGWYRRQVTIPASWSGRRLFLRVTGAARYAKAWIDGHYLGENIGYLSVAEFEVTPHVVPGRQAVVTIQVDSKQRWEVDALFGASSLADYMDVAWGGIWGHVELEARRATWLRDPYVRPDVKQSTCRVEATLDGSVAPSASARVKLAVYDRAGRCAAEAETPIDAKAAASRRVELEAAIPNAALWTPDSPTLYEARLTLVDGEQTLDAASVRFGMREFAVDGPYLLLNGKRIMLCGYGDDHIYPVQMAMPSDKELHLRQLRIIKSFGFNHVRHHSTMMPPEYYDACDEVGIITTAEFPIVYEPFIPGTGDRWKSNVRPGADPKPALDTYHREWAAAIVRHRNHPSILCWVMGNELYPDFPIRYSFHDIAKRLDPDRLYLDSDGVDAALLSDVKRDRKTVAIYDIQFAEWSDPILNVEKFKMPRRPIKPVLSHEAGNYTTFSRPDLVDQFQHNMKPFWLTAGRERLKQLGLSQEAEAWALKSERLYALCHKANLESLRKTPYLSGYHWWLFQDYWTSSNGLVDHYFRPKSITPEEVKQYNNDLVVLQDGLDRTYRGKDRLRIKWIVSNFSSDAIAGELRWELKVGDRSVQSKSVALKQVGQGELIDAAVWECELPETSQPEKVAIIATLKASPVAGGSPRVVSNNWSTRLYPSKISPPSVGVPVYVDAAVRGVLEGWDVRSIPEDGRLPEKALYVVPSLDSQTVDAVDRGASVVLLGGGGQFTTTRNAMFRPTWWKAGDGPDSNLCGTFVYDHPTVRAMAPDGWCDDGWIHLLEGGVKDSLAKLPSRPDVIVRALPSMAYVEDEAVLYEVGIGRGRLVVSGLNHERAKGRPENAWLLARLAEHAVAGPRPKSQWPVATIAVRAAAPDGCLVGFRRVVANEGEDSTWYSHRADKTRVLVCRQSSPGHRVTWETMPVKGDAAAKDRVTFVFAGGLGFGSQPKTEGFVLEINGRETLRFDLPEPRVWTSADRRVELRFDVRREIAPDFFGLFHLTLPKEMVASGMPVRIAVRSLGSGSQRWFGLVPYVDVSR